ncbi:MAG: hypothetical protein K6T83_20545 [Alicyclobacillus sp.]|nr:hypothetical protein [Alicyclobacillus sp.]
MSIEQAILREWIREARETALEHKRNRMRDPSNEYEAGALIAYYEMLDSLRNVVDAFGLDLHEYGLDFDLDEELLSLTNSRKRKQPRDVRTVAGAWKEQADEVRRELQEDRERGVCQENCVNSVSRIFG